MLYLKDTITLRRPFLNMVKPAKNALGYEVKKDLDAKKVTLDM